MHRGTSYGILIVGLEEANCFGRHMLNGLLAAHSGLRYLVLLAGVITLGYALFAVATNRPYDRTIRRLAGAFAGLLHLQILLGFVFVVSGRFSPQLIGHIFMMLAAAAVAQVPLSVLRRRPPEERRPLPHLLSTVVALLLIWGGIIAIGRGLLESTL